MSRRKLSPYFLLALLLILGWVSFQVVGVFLNYVLTGLFIAFITHPLYDRLESKIRFAPLASLLMVGIVGVVVVVPLAFILVELVAELRTLLVGLDVDVLRQQFDDAMRNVMDFLGFETTASEPGSDGGVFDILVPGLNAGITRFVSNLPSAALEGIIGLFVMLYILYYGYQDGHRFVESVRSILPLQDAHRDLLMHEVGNVIKAVMIGHVLTALIQAALAALGFFIFGVSNVVLLSALTFILALLPVVGPPLVWIPVGVGLLISGETFNGVGLLLYSAIMVSSLDNILRPKLIGDRAHIHPTIVLLGVLGGIVVFGFSGLILGPLVLSIFVTILDVYRKEFALRLDGDNMAAQ